MGAWGEDLLDNDAAGDLRVLWDDFILPAWKKDPKLWSPQRIVDFFRYFRAFDQRLTDESSEAAAEVLALGVLFRRSSFPISSRFKKVLEDAANAELRPERLNEWADTRKRKRVLESFLKTIGGKRRRAPVTGAPAPGSLDEEIRRMATFAKQYRRWIGVLKGPSPDAAFQRRYPDLFDRLVELLDQGTEKASRQTRHLAIKYRLMCVAWFTGCFLDLPDGEIMRLIEKAEATGGRLPLLGM